MGILDDGPPKEMIGHRAGTSHWADCYLEKDDATGVVLKVRIQGVENSEGGDVVLATPGTIFGDAKLEVVFAPSK